jgi:hypothetical protein
MSSEPEFRLACPYFVPENRCDAELWPHRARLPLGDGYEGRCSAPGYEDERPTQEQLKSACNLGNACCGRLPEDRELDSVRFYLNQDDGAALTVSFSTERAHSPREHGVLQFDAASGKFVAASAPLVVTRLAQAFVKSHLERHPRANAART